MTLIAVAWAGIAAYLNQKYASALDATIQTSRNLSRAFEENIRRTVEAIDTTIRAVRVAHAPDPDNFDVRAWERDTGLTRELTLQLAFADRDGVITTTNLATPAQKVSIADRPHFQITRDTPGDALFVSRPVLGRVSHRWSVQFVRKLFAPDGSFDGVIVGSLDPAFLSRFSQSLSIGQGALLLLGQDGVVRSAAPEQFAPLNEDLSRTALMQAIAANPQGTLQTGDIRDKVNRIYSWRRADPYGLTVVVGLSTADALAGFQQELVLCTSLGVILTVGVIVAGVLLSRRQQQLLGSWEILHAAVENISQGLLVVDKQRRVPVLNRRAAELLQLPPHLAKPNVRFDDILAWQLESGEFAGPEQAAVRELVQSGGIILGSNSYQRTRANGIVLQVQTKALDTGLAVRTLTDITEQQRYAQVLAEARDTAEAAARAKAEFLATMSHEIRTPLNGVIGIAELLQDMELGPTQRDYVRTIRESGDHLLQLINDILDFSRLEASRVELEEVAFDPAGVARGMADLFRTQANRKGLDLSVTLTTLPPAVIGDPGRLRQVLFNLVGNAIKFTDSGWIDITVAADPVADERVRLVVRVTDTGIGMDPMAIERMFEEFTQADGSISRRFGGSGLGLAICERLVSLMGGTIRVESEPGRGSAFVFDLTLKTAPAPADAAPPAQPEAAAPPARPPLKVLVAEDNSTNKLVVMRLLGRLGHHGHAVDDGAQAVAAFGAAQYDLILMDVMMPEMDGLTATRLIRASEPPGAHIPIIGLTAGSQADHLDKCIAAGMDATATKPITLSRLREVIDDTLDHPPASPMNVPSNRMQELKDELGEDVAAEIFLTFAEETGGNLQALWEAASHGDAKQVQRLAHSVAGAAHNVGMVALARRCKGLEEGVGRLSGPQIMAVVAAMQRDFDDTLPQLGLPASPPAEPECHPLGSTGATADRETDVLRPVA